MITRWHHHLRRCAGTCGGARAAKDRGRAGRAAPGGCGKSHQAWGRPPLCASWRPRHTSLLQIRGAQLTGAAPVRRPPRRRCDGSCQQRRDGADVPERAKTAFETTLTGKTRSCREELPLRTVWPRRCRLLLTDARSMVACRSSKVAAHRGLSPAEPGVETGSSTAAVVTIPLR